MKKPLFIALCSILVAQTASAGRPDNGRPDNGRPDNGRPDNGRPDNGRPDNGAGTAQHETAFIWAYEPSFNWIFAQPWTQANFDANRNTWAVFLCHEPDAIELKYLFKVGLAPSDEIYIELDCNLNGTIESPEKFVLRGNLNYAPALRTGTLLSNETQKQRLTNVMSAVTNDARSMDDSTAVIHNQLRTAAAFDLADSNATEAFPWHRRTATKVGAVKTACPTTLNRWSNNPYTYGAYSTFTTTYDPDCGYQTNKSRVFRVSSSTATVNIGASGMPAGKKVFLRVSTGLEAGFREPTGTTYVSPTVLTYIMTAGASYSVTLPNPGLYNVTWAVESTADLPTASTPTLWDGLSINVSTVSGTVGYNDLDIFNLRESVFYSRNGGMFNMNNVGAGFRACQLVGQWVQVAVMNGPSYWVYSHVTYNPANNTYGTCQRPTGALLFDNVYQQNDSFWNIGATDLATARSCSAATGNCSSQRPGVANTGGSPVYTVASAGDWSVLNNTYRSSPSARILGEFTRNYFPYSSVTGWTIDETGNAVTTFLTDAAARAPISAAFRATLATLVALSPASKP